MDAKSNKKKIILIATAIPLLIILAFVSLVGLRAGTYSKITFANEISDVQAIELQQKSMADYKERFQILQPLPYTLGNPNVPVGAEAAILIDVTTGNVIFEKNADEVIPPASMTKLFAMYVVDEEVSAGRFTYDQIIPLPEESWACNMPPHSSLMFLGEGQIVTLEELLLGLSICSGNDAAYALAYTISGSMEGFIERMNKIAENLGLTHTHFVESSGYSEKNTTTAREMAAFCKVYLNEHPDSLERFHSVPKFTYPKAKNMAPGDVYGPQDFSNGFPRHITMGITQSNTNPLLGRYKGVDGLKTGFIDESGYNLALTAQRKGTRFLSVTMRGQGRNTVEGQENRVRDGSALMDFAFGSFQDYPIASYLQPYFVKVYGSKEKAINLVPAFNAPIVCVPFVAGSSMEENLSMVEVSVELPENLFGEVLQGEVYGKIKVSLGEYVLETIPLVADRTTTKANFIFRAADALID